MIRAALIAVTLIMVSGFSSCDMPWDHDQKDLDKNASQAAQR